jgi:hypothetical protein
LPGRQQSGERPGKRVAGAGGVHRLDGERRDVKRSVGLGKQGPVLAEGDDDGIGPPFAQVLGRLLGLQAGVG